MASGTLTGTATVSSGTSAISVRLVWSSAQAVDANNNPIANTSKVTASYQMKRAATNFSSSSTFFITIDGTKTSDTNGYTYPNDNAWHTIMTATKTITHTANGSKSIVLDAGGVNSGTSWLTSSFTATTVALDDFVIVPTTPTTLTPSRTNNGASLSVTLSGSTFVGTSAGYYWQYSTDQVNYSSNQNSGVAASVTPTTQYYVRGWANDSEGNSGYVYGGPYAGIPSTPTAPTISNAVSTSLTLSWTAPASNGSSITSYTIQGTTDGGLTWSNITTSSTTTANLTNLTIAATYLFRIIAVNAVGESAAGAQSESRFISAYGYRYASGTFTPVTFAARYTGNSSDSVTLSGTTYTGWKQISFMRRHSGTTFIDFIQ